MVAIAWVLSHAVVKLDGGGSRRDLLLPAIGRARGGDAPFLFLRASAIEQKSLALSLDIFAPRFIVGRAYGKLRQWQMENSIRIHPSMAVT